jgi:anti-sigma B factor antagonist
VRPWPTGLNGSPERLIVDLSGMLFCGSAGIGALIQARAKAVGQATEFVLVCSRLVSRPLELAGLLDLFTVRGSVQDVLERLSPE